MMRKQAQDIAREGNISIGLVSQVYASALASGASHESVRALALSGRIEEALRDDFSWQEVNVLVKKSNGDDSLLAALLAAGITGKEVDSIDVSEKEVQQGISLLGMLR